MIDTAIILAGGLGTRLKPLTDKTPKPLLLLQEKPILEHTLDLLKKYGVKKVILSVGYKAEQIQEYFQNGKKFGLDISYSLEKELLGTGGAVKQASKGLNKPFFLLWGDNLSDVNLQEMYAEYLRDAVQITMALTSREDVENFGTAVLQENTIINFVEKPKRKEAPSNLINAGVFIIEPECLKILPEGKSSIEKDCFEKLAPIGNISAYIHKGQWFPTDTIDKYNFAYTNFHPINNNFKR